MTGIIPRSRTIIAVLTCVRTIPRVARLYSPLAVGVLLVFGAVVWNTYRQGIRDNGAGIPSVIADKQPYKRAPEDREGVAIPDTDKRFYDQMDDSERPIMSESQVAELENAEDGLLQGGPQLSCDPVEKALSPMTARCALWPTWNPCQKTRKNPCAWFPPLRPHRRQHRKSNQSLFQRRLSSRFRMAAHFWFNSQRSAHKKPRSRAWTELNRKKPELFGSATKHIQRADLGAKGVFYRLRVGSFADRADASEFCDAVKAAGDNCIVVTG